MYLLINRALFFFFTTLLIVSFIACKEKTKDAGPSRQNAPTVVDVMIAFPQPVSNEIEANGTIVANEYIQLLPEVSGRLTYLNVPEGKMVSKGTVLAKINDADLRAQLNKSRVQLQLAETTVGRYKQLLDVSGINQSDYDIAVNSVNSLRADMDYTRSLIEKTIIRAPFSGVAGLRQVSPGAYVTPQTIIATLQQVSQVKVDFTLPEAYGNIVTAGQEVDVAIDGINNRLLASISAIEPGANTNTRNIKVRALLKNDKESGTINPGAFAKVYIKESKERTAIMVPTNAIIPNEKNNQVIVVKKGMASFVDVVTGNRKENEIEITDGLKEGDSIVVTGVLFARPKSKLKIRSVKNLADKPAVDTTKKI